MSDDSTNKPKRVITIDLDPERKRLLTELASRCIPPLSLAEYLAKIFEMYFAREERERFEKELAPEELALIQDPEFRRQLAELFKEDKGE